MPAAQGKLFLAMMICGAGLGLLRGALGLALRGNAACVLLDLLLGACCAAGMTAIGLELGENPFRLYAFAGILAGLAFDKAILGTIVRLFCKFFMISSKKVEK